MCHIVRQELNIIIMSYLVLNRKNKRDCNFQLPYFNSFYKQTKECLSATKVKHENYKTEDNIYVANTPLTNQICVLPNQYITTNEDQTAYLKGNVKSNIHNN